MSCSQLSSFAFATQRIAIYLQWVAHAEVRVTTVVQRMAPKQSEIVSAEDKYHTLRQHTIIRTLMVIGGDRLVGRSVGRLAGGSVGVVGNRSVSRAFGQPVDRSVGLDWSVGIGRWESVG